MKRIVIDTNVVIATLHSKNGASNKLMTLIGADHFELCMSVPLLLEYEEIIVRNFPTIKKSEIKQFLDYICMVSIHVQIHFLWRPTLKDSDDDMILELAVSGGAKYIVTHNIADFKEARKFGVIAITPRDFLKNIGG